MARCGSASEAPSSMKMALLIFLLLLSSEPPGTVSCVWIKHSEHCCDKDIKKCINGAEGVDYVAAEDSHSHPLAGFRSKVCDVDCGVLGWILFSK